jgi:hypothetical protein
MVKVQILALCVAAIAACAPSVSTSQSNPSPASQPALSPTPTNATPIGANPTVTTPTVTTPTVTTTSSNPSPASQPAPSPTQANATPTGAAASTLTIEDQTALKALGIAIAVPTDVPPGYTVSQVKLDPCPADSPRSAEGVCRFGPDYGIVYRNATQDSCFAIEATGGGVGGPGAEYRLPFSIPLFGDGALQFGEGRESTKTPSAEQLDSPQPNIYTDWGSKDGGTSGPFYRLAGADGVRGAYLGERDGQPATQCQNTITPNEAVKITQSLTWLE